MKGNFYRYNQTKILDLFKTKKYITTKNVGGFRRLLECLIVKNKIVRLSGGIYTLTNELEDGVSIDIQ